MSNGVKVYFSPKHPLIWFAEYHPNIKQIKIPKCFKCNDLAFIKDYNYLHCACGCQELTWNVEDGAKCIDIDHFLLEFDEDGNETVNYRYIPHDGLIKFGLLDPSFGIAYGIEILTGRITIGSFIDGSQPFTIGTGINTETEKNNLVKISDYIEKGEAELQLQYSKRAIQGGNLQVSVLNYESMAQFQMDPQNLTISNIAVGYTCSVPNWDFEVIIRVDCNTHIPYFTSTATPRTSE